jgi:N-acetylneuraminate synthase/sialic acid synthase
MPRELTIAGRPIADNTDCYVIAEIGNNHQGDVKKCKELFLAAKECGADAVKLQKRDNRTLYTKDMYNGSYNNENSYGETYGAHREFLEFDMAEYRELQNYAKELGIAFFATAWDFRSADFLASLSMPAFKIASGDLTNIPLLKYVAGFGKPIILSTGGGMMEDVIRAYDTIMPINPQLSILQCTAGYPPEFEELNLRVIESFRAAFPDIVIGLSSHDSGIAMALVGYMLGARVIEKHFTLNRALKGTDHAFSLERSGMQKMVRDLRRARIAIGDGVKQRYPSEQKPLLKMSKKLVVARDLPAGHVLTEADIAIKSPGDGLPPWMFDELIGRELACPLREDESLTMKALVPQQADSQPASMSASAA